MRSIDFAQLAQNENIALLFRNRIRERSSQRPEYWSQLIKKIKKIYLETNLCSNWDDFDKVPFWNELDYIGIDAYFPCLPQHHRCWNLMTLSSTLKK
jgi:hypothetical protein